MTLELHPLCEMFPELPRDQFIELANDIKENGVLDPIVLMDNMILDGRNRYRAAIYAGLDESDLPFTDWNGEGGSPAQFVIAKNMHRRHLTPSQRGALTVQLSERMASEAIQYRESDESLAKSMQISRGTVARAKRLKKDSPTEFEKVVAGEKSIGQAIRDADVEKDEDTTEPQSPEVKDGLGNVLANPKFHEIFADRQFTNISRLLREAVESIKRLMETGPGTQCNGAEYAKEIEDLRKRFHTGRPFTICCHCVGVGCRECLSTGWISKRTYSALPSDYQEACCAAATGEISKSKRK